jgi:23S rRNA (uracil1939-C5)-methyltransferase
LPERVGYRNRIRLRIDGQGKIGFFNSNKSPGCVILLPALRRVIAQLREWSESQGPLLAPFAHLEARAPDREGNSGLFLTRKDGAVVSGAVELELAASIENQRVATDADAAIPHQRFDIDSATYQLVPLNAFLQVNFEVNRHLTEHVVRGALSRNVRSFADVFCGSGNFALPLAKAGLTGVGVERVSTCKEAATRAAREQALNCVRFVEGDAITTCRHWLAAGLRFDAVVVDPPRAGVRENFDVLMALARRSLVYCSCNLESLARDLRVLLAAGWQLDELTGFDMFPGTVHLETIAWLSRP